MVFFSVTTYLILVFMLFRLLGVVFDSGFPDGYLREFRGGLSLLCQVDVTFILHTL